MQRIRITDGPTRDEIISAKKGNKMVFKHAGGDLEVHFLGATSSTERIGLNIKVMLGNQECSGHYNHCIHKGYIDCAAAS